MCSLHPGRTAHHVWKTRTLHVFQSGLREWEDTWNTERIPETVRGYLRPHNNSQVPDEASGYQNKARVLFNGWICTYCLYQIKLTVGTSEGWRLTLLVMSSLKHKHSVIKPGVLLPCRCNSPYWMLQDEKPSGVMKADLHPQPVL